MKNPFEVYTSLHNRDKHRPLEWEESALDSQKKVEAIFDEERTTPPLRVLWFFMSVCFVIVCFRLFHLQVVQGNTFRDLSENNRIRQQTILAPRGLIVDSRGLVLAENTASFNLVAIPFDLPKEGLEDEVRALSSTFSLDEAALTTKLSKIDRASFQPVVIAQDITQEQSILFETRAAEFFGFQVLKIPIRQYPEPEVFAHLLGYTGIVSEDDLSRVDKDQYDTADYIGKSGIELSYEQYLHGKNGQNLVEVDAAGKLLSVLGENAALPGNQLVLNIDKELQEKLYHDLTEGFAGRRAAAVAMNPKTGAVLAFVSVPGFNNNLFAHGIKQGEYNKLLTDKNLPLFNRVISGTYPPGSTVKPMVGAAVLEDNIVNENTVIVDNGVLVIPNQFNPALSYNFYGWKREGLGPMNVRSAIAKSSDIYFYTVAGGHPSSPVKGMGAERLAYYYRTFGLGKATGIDIQGEKSGVVADPDWKASYFKDNAVMSKWYLGDTYHIGIGQGDMLVTPLQVAEWTAAIANNGVGMKPKIAKEVRGEFGDVVWENKPEVLLKAPISAENMKVIQEGMRETVTAGSGLQLNTLSITSAGKTGTSQFDGSDPSRTHAWFTAYAPFEDPQIVIVVLVEAGGEGNAVSVPVVKKALDWWEKNRYNK